MYREMMHAHTCSFYIDESLKQTLRSCITDVLCLPFTSSLGQALRPCVTIRKTVNVHAVLMKAHPRQHWKALGQARNLVKRCTRPLGQRPESQYKSYSRPYETNPQTETNMYVSKGMCTSSLGQTLRPGQTYIYIIYIRDRPTQPEAIRRCPELGEVVSLEPKCVYIYIYSNI